MSKRKSKTFPVVISTVAGACKRSVTMLQIEVLWITCKSFRTVKHRNSFDLSMSFPNGELNKAVTVKKLPLGYLKKFTIAE